MIRRDFLRFLGGAAVACPVAARAQPTRDVRRIAILMGTATNELGRSYLTTFTQRLEQLGWANGLPLWLVLALENRPSSE